MLSTDENGYALPFEVVSILLLAAMIGCIVIAIKDQNRETSNELKISGSISHILFVSTALFFIGMYGLFTRRNMITMLMSIELILNSVNINFIAFNKYLYPDKLDGFSSPYLLLPLLLRKQQWQLQSLLIFTEVISRLMWKMPKK